MKKAIFILFILSLPLSSKAQGFLNQWDFDADGVNDTITYEYSGGAHCCYQIKVWTSQKNKVWDFSHYEMDGGYIMGLDNSQPHFKIRNFDSDSAPEIYIASGTYNGDYSMSQEVLLDYMNGVFISLPFDFYSYERSKKTISCSGKNGIEGYYIARDEDAISELNILNNHKVDFSSRPRGVGGWENNYKGEWKIKDSVLTITFTHLYYSDIPDDLEKMEKPIKEKYILSEKNCILIKRNPTTESYYFKE